MVARTLRLTTLFAAYPIAGALVTLAGWAANVPRLADWDGDGIAQLPNNAVGVLVVSIALLCVVFRKPLAARTLGTFAAAIGAATLFEHATGVDLGIDRVLLFGHTWGQRGAVVFGRMGIPGATSLVILCVSGIAATIPRGRRLATAGGLVTIGIAMLAIIGYAFGANTLFAIPRVTAIASQTSTMLLALALALLAALPESAPMRLLFGDSGATLLVRRALLPVIVAPIVLGWLRLRAQDAGLIDTQFGTALLVLAVTAITVALLWWCASAIDDYERAMRRSRDRLAAILGSITDPFLTVDDEWRIAFMNDESKILLRGGDVGALLWDVLPSADAHDALRGAMTDRVAVEYEVFDPRLDVWFLLRAYPTESGGLAIHARDLTSRKRAEEALLAADRMKDEFLATLSHEIRTPLTAIVGWSHMLTAGGLDAREQQVAIEAIRSSARAQSQLVEDVLDVSRIVTGKLRLQRTMTELASVIDHAVATVTPAAEAKRIALRLRLDRTLPELFVDPERLQQVAWNLLSNAIKFSPEGSAIDVVLRGEDERIALDVIDRGPGIPADFLPHVFERFRQADSSASRPHAGLGIGLALSKDLVELHGGTISVRSEEARGSHFTVRLPMPANRRRSDVTGATTETSTAMLDGVRVLYVDDREDARVLVSTMLRQYGADVVPVASVDEALASLARRVPDVVVTDLATPRRDGYDILATLRAEAEWARVPVLALTAQARIDDEAQAARAGFRSFLRKPIEADKLAEAVAASVR